MEKHTFVQSYEEQCLPKFCSRLHRRYSPYGQHRKLPEGPCGSHGHQTSLNDVYFLSRSENKMHSTNEKSWYKVMIPYGDRYNISWLLNSIKKQCAVSFSEVQFQHCHGKAIFYVESEMVAVALENVSRKIEGENGHKIVINVLPCNPPLYAMKNFCCKDISPLLRVCIEKRYNKKYQSLNLSCIRADGELTSSGVSLHLNIVEYMECVLKIIEKSCPEIMSLDLSRNNLNSLSGLSTLVYTFPTLKKLNLSENKIPCIEELNIIKGLKITELFLAGNPLCDSFENPSFYLSAVRQRFPELRMVDGIEIPPLVVVTIEMNIALPPLKVTQLLVIVNNSY
ncbi:nuclear RNA export factor 1-like [Protopterus annectens]|uniref:nuclear RNA export factor 1-like n=1 Tax=Protopterus annectens TaxID=7888 RepID=UPI001CFBF5B8|nr:nuclear RNA export factor 1-like [Protopterus annectens]